MRRTWTVALIIVVVAAAAGAAWLLRWGRPASGPSGSALPSVSVYAPPELADAAWLDDLKQQQLAAASSITAFHGFRFTDRLPESGITWTNRVVDDAGKTYKAVHYDHGNGVAVADVDGDGLLDLYFVTQVGSNALYRNLGEGRFEDITAAAGVGLPDVVGVTASFADIDNDGDPDLYVTTVRGGNHLFENDGHGTFTDISVSAGVDYVGHSSAAVFFDYNRDGLLDLFLVNVGRYTSEQLRRMADGHVFYDGLVDAFSGHLHPERAEASILYRNDGDNRFTDVSAAVGLRDTSWSGDAAPVDLNEDGWMDLYVLSMQGDDQYYENQNGTRFVRKSRDIFPRTSWGAMGIKVFDFDNDGRQDIYIVDMHSDMSHVVPPAEEREKSHITYETQYLGDSNPIFGNSFFLNRGGGRFEEVSDQINAENFWPWGLSAGDLNADGFDDVFIASSMNYSFRYGVNSLKLNDGGRRFADAEFILGIEPRRDGRTTVPWFDLDGDGADAGHADLQGHTGRVTVNAAIGSRSSAIFDLDNDGDLDIVTNDFNSAPMILVSDLTDRTPVHYLAIRLVGSRSNRDGLGARVRVTAGGRVWTKVNDGQSGYLSHSLLPLYFGLGEAASVDRIEITWPSGQVQVLTPDTANATIVAREP